MVWEDGGGDTASYPIVSGDLELELALTTSETRSFLAEVSYEQFLFTANA